MGCWFCNVPRLLLTGRRSCCFVVVLLLLLLSCQSPRDNPLRRHHTILSACPLFMAGGIPSFLPPFSLSPGNHLCCEHPPITCALAHGGTSAGPPREDGCEPLWGSEEGQAERTERGSEALCSSGPLLCCHPQGSPVSALLSSQHTSSLPPPLFFFLSISISERCGGGLSSCLADLTLPAVPWHGPVHWNTTSSWIQFN